MQLINSEPLQGDIVIVDGHEWNFMRLQLHAGEVGVWYESHLIGFSLVPDSIADLLEEQFQAQAVGSGKVA